MTSSCPNVLLVSVFSAAMPSELLPPPPVGQLVLVAEAESDSVPVGHCPVCRAAFNLSRPRRLPCGHTICDTCLDLLISQGAELRCRTCKEVHPTTSYPEDHLVSTMFAKTRIYSDFSLGDTGRPKSIQMEPVDAVDEHSKPAVTIETYVNENTRYLIHTKSFGRFGYGEYELTLPISMGVTKDCHYVIGDRRDNRIVVFDKHYHPYSWFTVEGELQAVSVNDDGDILVAVSQSDCMALLYTIHGTKLQGFLYPKGNGTCHPCGVFSTDSFDGPLYIVLTAEGYGYVYNDNSHLIDVFGSLRPGDDAHMRTPYYGTANRRGDYIITDYSEDNLLSFTPYRSKQITLQYNIKELNKSSILRQPHGICADRHLNTLVADFGNSDVKIFYGSGVFIGSLLSFPAAQPDVRCRVHPVDLCLTQMQDSFGVLVVGDRFCQIRLYDYYPPTFGRAAAAATCCNIL